MHGQIGFAPQTAFQASLRGLKIAISLFKKAVFWRFLGLFWAKNEGLMLPVS
jgi:hypothetical protein